MRGWAVAMALGNAVAAAGGGVAQAGRCGVDRNGFAHECPGDRAGVPAPPSSADYAYEVMRLNCVAYIDGIFRRAATTPGTFVSTRTPSRVTFTINEPDEGPLRPALRFLVEASCEVQRSGSSSTAIKREVQTALQPLDQTRR